MKKKGGSGEATEAERLVMFLTEKAELKREEIAARLRVSLNSVIRWQKGVMPHPGSMARLRRLAGAERARLAKDNRRDTHFVA